MKRIFKYLTIFVLFLGLIFPLVFCLNFNFKKVQATVSSPDITKSTYKDYDFDESLFQAVLAMAKQLNCNQALIGRGFDVDLFLKNTNSSYSPSYVETGAGTENYEENLSARNQIVDDLKIGILDLTTGENAKYECLKKVNPIKNITGLNSLNLDFIKKINLSNNFITEIKLTDFESLTKLQEINCSYNNLTKFELNSSINNLSVLNLRGNYIKEINISNLVANSNVDLSNNKIEGIEKITFSSNKKLSSLDLDFNLLKNLSSQDLEILNSKVQTSLNIGIQGFNSEKLTAGDLIKVYNFNNNTLQNISVKIYYFEGNETSSKSEFYVNGENNLICSTLGTQSLENLYLPAGKLKIEFYSNNTIINQNLYPNYSTRVLNVKLPNLKYSIVINGQTVESTYQENNFQVDFYFDENENIPNLEAVLENAKIYSYINDQTALELNTLSISNNGTFNCSAYVMFDNISSEITSVSVTRRYITGIVMGVVVIIFLIALIAAGYIITRWYRSGAVVAPLSEKEIAAINRRKAKQQEEVRETFIRGAGKERFFKKKEDDEVLDNLNSKKEIGSYYNANETGDYDKNNYSPNFKVGNNFEKYNNEEFKNDFDEDNANNEDLNNDD